MIALNKCKDTEQIWTWYINKMQTGDSTKVIDDRLRRDHRGLGGRLCRMLHILIEITESTAGYIYWWSSNDNILSHLYLY